MLKFELVVPAYNEAQNIEAVIERAALAAQGLGWQAGEFQLVVVQNGSTDNSDEVLKTIEKNQALAPWFRVVKVDKNRGYGYGLLQGLNSTKADIVGWSHADQQCDPADALKAYSEIEKSSNKRQLVKGVRFARSLRDRIVSRVFELLARLILGIKVFEMNAQPKVFSRELLGKLKAPPQTFAFDLYVLYQAIKANYEVKSIPVRFPPRIHGLSKWASNFFSRYKTILGMIRYMLDLRRDEGRA